MLAFQGNSEQWSATKCLRNNSITFQNNLTKTDTKENKHKNNTVYNLLGYWKLGNMENTKDKLKIKVLDCWNKVALTPLETFFVACLLVVVVLGDVLSIDHKL